MGIWDIFKSKEVIQKEAEFSKGLEDIKNNAEELQSAAYIGSGYGTNDIVYIGESSNVLFDGEKTIGELGAPVNLVPDYKVLRQRAYEADLKSNIIRLIAGKYFKWCIGAGLKLQVETEIEILALEGIKGLDFEKIKMQAEKRFNLFAFSKRADFSKMDSFHSLAMQAYETAFLGGDCLAIFRIDPKTFYPTCQIIDGQEIIDPYLTSEHYKKAEESGNIIIKGVEIDAKGEHVAFYVNSVAVGGKNEVQRIPAKIDGSNFTMAKMIYIRKHRIKDVRGVSSVASILEKVNKLDRYSEATVGSAEERANLAYYITHDKDSTGENPLKQALVDNLKSGGGAVVSKKVDPYDQAEGIAGDIRRTTSKMVVNLPIGSDMDKLDSDAGEINYPEFFGAVIEEIAASMDTPPEVAMQKYSSNYSASRAAINGWEYMIEIGRSKFAEELYQPFYELFFYTQVLLGKIDAGNAYLKAMQSDDFMVSDAFTNARFIGAKMPHIDPLKEVNAVRKQLGKALDHVPIISLDQASEKLNSGDFNQNYKKLLKEMEINKIEFQEDSAEPEVTEETSKKTEEENNKKQVV